jgi:hypothetical protein
MDKIDNWMAVGKIRRNNVIKLRSLQDLCVASVYKHLPEHSKKSPHPFKHLSNFFTFHPYHVPNTLTLIRVLYWTLLLSKLFTVEMRFKV